MILLDKCLEFVLDCYIREHCERQRKYGIAGSAGFLIGSKMDEDFHVAHIAMCAYPDTMQDETGDIHSKSVDADWIADIGSRVLRFLPGGTMIVGLLWLADSKSSLQSAQVRGMLVRALSQIAVRHNALSSLNIKLVDNCLALIGIETPLGKPYGCIVDCSRKGAAGSQTKVSFSQLEWVRLESSAAFRLSEPLTDGVWDFHKQFTSAIHEWAKYLLKTDIALVNGLSRSRDEFLRSRDRKNRGPTTFDIEIFLNAGEKHDSNNDMDNQNISSFCTIDLIVDTAAKAAVPSKATVGQAIDAVKEHIIRSLCSRAELHYESTDVIEDEPKDRLAVHQLPRATYVSLPSQRAIVFTDYLFESDTASDAQQSFAEFLTLKVPEDDIDVSSERHLEGNDLLNMLNEDDRPSRVDRSSSSTSSLSSVILPPIRTGEVTSINYYFLIAVLVALLSFVVYLLMKTVASSGIHDEEMTLSRTRVFGSLLRHSNAVLQYYRYKSSYAINGMLGFQNEEENEQEKEIRSKYVFRSRLPILIENDHFDAPFQHEYDKICREYYAWDSEMNAIKTVWERLKPPPQEKVEDNVLAIGNLRSLPWAPNEWCIERAFDCYRNKRDVIRIHLTMKYLEMLKILPDLSVGVMLNMAHHIQQKVLIERTRKLFELVCQTYYTGDMKKLIESDENTKPIVEYMHQVEQFEAEKRELLNITEQDIVTVAPGLYGAFQDFFRVYFASTYSLSITCCALYQKNILYRMADKKYNLTKNQIAMPYEYSYNVPHLIFGNFGYWYSRRKKQFELYDLHILAFPVLPWYKDLPGTHGKFFSPKYERIPLSTNIFI